MSITPSTQSQPSQGRWLPLTLWVLALVFEILGIGLSVLNGSAYAEVISSSVVFLMFSTVGYVIASRRPENPIGWLMGIGALCCILMTFTQSYAIYTLLTQPGSLPGGAAMAWIGMWIGNMGFGPMIFFSLLLFPTGRLPSAHWRGVAWLNSITLVAFVFVSALLPGPVWFDASGSIRNPLGIESAATVLQLIANILNVVSMTVCLALSAAAPILRFRKANGIERQQFKWVVYAAFIFLGFITLIYIPVMLFSPPPIVNLAFYLTVCIVLSSLPLSISLAILQYRLWDIDFFINRSLVYGVLTAALVAAFGGSLWLASFVVQGQSFIVAFGVTAVLAGTLFTPARRRLQRFVDQRLYHIYIDYQKTPPPALQTSSMTQVLRQTHFGDYQNLELIGRGGMAEVYKSTHPTLGKPIAIKILPAHLAAEHDFCQRFTREAQVVANMHHPNIVRIFDYGEQNGMHYIVMEYLVGQDLNELIKTTGKLSLAQTLPLVHQIAAALDYAHGQGLVHRDIKPSNVMVDTASPKIRAVLMDFGIAKISNAHTALTHTGSMLGTLDYIAPEQIQASADVDGRADIYALGVMIYQMLAGELPFKHTNPGALLIAHLTQPPPDIRQVVPNLPSHIAAAIQRAMAKQPEERFATASELAAEIGRHGI